MNNNFHGEYFVYAYYNKYNILMCTMHVYNIMIQIVYLMVTKIYYII